MKWPRYLLPVLLTIAVVYRVMLFAAEISTSPWSLSWSEGSRYYYASLYFSEKIYGMDAPISVLHPTRYLMQAIAFLLPNSPIWLHRLWQVLLWLATTFASGWWLAARIRQRNLAGTAPPTVAFMGWSFLFLMQGPVYYNLLIIVIFMLWGVQSHSFGRTLVIVVIASIWAGLSRLNWYPMPGLIAAALYLLENPVPIRQPDRSMGKPVTLSRTWIDYALAPAGWILLGTLIAFFSNRLYAQFSGNPAQYFGSALESDLLWYRLFPNATNAIGILPLIIFVSFPLGFVIFYKAWHLPGRHHFLRMVGLVSILGLLFIGGLVVSVKIGGGSNLHNLDAYLVMLWLTGTYFYFESLSPDILQQQRLRQADVPVWPAIIVPVIMALSLAGPSQYLDKDAEDVELESLRQALHAAKGDVLFISQRQLLTFGEIEGVDLVPDNELVFLMEMAMSNNEDYLNTFYADLVVARYEFIVTDPLFIVIKGKDSAFPEENNIWVERVSIPVLCYYEPILNLNDVKVQILAPRRDFCGLSVP